VVAAVGSAVGLGNMWRFSYLATEHGGAAFVVFYLGFTLIVGLPVLLAELALGRGSGRSPILALAHYGGRAWTPLGALFVASGFLILAYYSVIGGWTVRYALEAITVGFAADSAAHFGAVSEGWSAAAWHLGFMAITVSIVAGGIHAGIERVSLVLMPLLFVLVCGIALYGATLPGGGAGYRFYLEIELDELLATDALEHAAGQAFFSLSLGMGAMMTYASYLSEQDHLPNESLIIALADFAVAFVAGLMVFPLLFALGLQGQVGASSVGALFVTLPQSFIELGTAGRFVGFLFFSALIFGALTSAISLLEVVVSSAIDSLGWRRRPAALGLGAVIFALGVPAALDIKVLDWMDKLAGNIFLVFGGLALSIFVGWRMHDPLAEVQRGATRVRWFGLWIWLLRIPVPLALAFVLYRSVRALF
jgi:NSS family neurotransmitter:Na+ symporter